MNHRLVQASNNPLIQQSTMRALQLQAIDRLVEVELPVPEPKADEVLVRTVATTICTSDLNDIAHNPFGIALPRVMGHEGAGVVAALGEGVSQFHVGDRVAAHPVIPCRTCENCRRGLGHLCSHLGHLGLDRDGTFAEFFCIRADRARRIPPAVEFAAAALLEPVAVCLEAVRARSHPTGRDRPDRRRRSLRRADRTAGVALRTIDGHRGRPARFPSAAGADRNRHPRAADARCPAGHPGSQRRTRRGRGRAGDEFSRRARTELWPALRARGPIGRVQRRPGRAVRGLVQAAHAGIGNPRRLQ